VLCNQILALQTVSFLTLTITSSRRSRIVALCYLRRRAITRASRYSDSFAVHSPLRESGPISVITRFLNTHPYPCILSLLLISLLLRLPPHQHSLNHVPSERTRDNDTQSTIQHEILRSTGSRVCRRVVNWAKLDVSSPSSAEEARKDFLAWRKDRGVDFVCDLDGGSGSREV
jgi:hypothetical protein